MSMDDRLARVVRQHAMTSRLMGVDFIPRYREAPDADPSPTPGTPTRSVGVIEAHPSSAARSVAVPQEAVRARDESARRARAAELAELQARYEREAPHQHFATDHHTIVFHDGDPCARLCFVGEAPGADEDRVGRPFVGRAGQLLDKMIVAMGLKREDVYICNVLKTRPPNNATPTTDEIRLCAPYLLEQLRIVSPEVIVTLGLPATRALLDSTESMGALRGRWHQFDARGVVIPVMPTYHPAFLLRSYTPENRKKIWSDLQMAMARLGMPTREGGA